MFSVWIALLPVFGAASAVGAPLAAMTTPVSVPLMVFGLVMMGVIVD